MMERSAIRRLRRTRVAHRFTLVELLAALAIVVVLIAALLFAFHSALMFREHADAAATADIPVQHGLADMERDISCVVPPDGGLSSVFLGQTVQDKDTRADTLELCTASNSPRSGVFGSDIIEVVYQLEASADGQSQNFVRSVYRNLLAPQTEEPEDTILMRNARSLQFSYFDGTDWVDSWDASQQDNAVPQAIHMRLELGTANQTEKLVELTVPILAQGPQQQTGGGTQQ